MVKRFLAACLFLSSMGMMAQSRKADSLKVINLDGVNVVSTRVGATTPVAHTNVSKEQIAEMNTGKDLPYLLSLTPSVTMTSDAGNGMGYTSMRVRGVDPSRINVTTNVDFLTEVEKSSQSWVQVGSKTDKGGNQYVQKLQVNPLPADVDSRRAIVYFVKSDLSVWAMLAIEQQRVTE